MPENRKNASKNAAARSGGGTSLIDCAFLLILKCRASLPCRATKAVCKGADSVRDFSDAAGIVGISGARVGHTVRMKHTEILLEIAETERRLAGARPEEVAELTEKLLRLRKKQFRQSSHTGM